MTQQSGQTYEPRKVNELKLGVARVRAGTGGVGYDKMLADVVLLLEEHAVARHQGAEAVDRGLVDHLAKKYGVTV